MPNAVTIDQAALRALFSDPSGPVAAAVEQRALEGRDAMVRLLSEPGGGRVYLRPQGAEIASAPGQPPAPFTRRLVDSIHVEMRVGPAGVYALVGSDEPEAHLTEFGTIHMAPRPFIRPTLALIGGDRVGVRP
jgi:hypothetical protein